MDELEGWQDLLESAARLLGLRAWRIELALAREGELAQGVLAESVVEDPAERRAKILLRPGLAPDTHGQVIWHELMHIVISPCANTWPAAFVLEEIQVGHFERALQAVIEGYRFPVLDNIEQVVAEARDFTGLAINDWRIHIEPTDGPTFAFSEYYRNGIGWGAFAARSITLQLNSRAGPGEIVRELFRVVLNPYGRPDRAQWQDNVLEKVMPALDGLGLWELWHRAGRRVWGERGCGGTNGRKPCSECRRCH